MSASENQSFLPSDTTVPFADIEAAFARQGHHGVRGRALTATIVAIGPEDRLDAAAEALRGFAESGAVRAILISHGLNPEPEARVGDGTVALAGLKPDFLNNAVAALRLSSLPTMVWWRGGNPEALDGLADLADRIVLDAIAPEPVWARAQKLFDRAAFSDLRWTRLTRWRALMAHFFDVPEVRAAAAGFTSLRVAAGDRAAATLFVAWLKASLGWTDSVRIELADTGGSAALEEVRLGGSAQELILRLVGSRRCVETAARVQDHIGASRIVWLGDQSLAALMNEELRVRSRDAAFERALDASVGGA